MNAQERGLLLEHTFMDPEYAERLRAVAGKEVAGKRDLVGDYTLEDLEDMLGYIAAHANHAEDLELQEKLDALYERLALIQKSYDDGMWQDGIV